MAFDENQPRDDMGKWVAAGSWPGKMSEYDQESGKVEILVNQVEKLMRADQAPRAMVRDPKERTFATQNWLSEQGGGDPVFPDFEDKHGKLPILAKTPDDKLHILDGHHTIAKSHK